jgi:hypothetical protein
VQDILDEELEVDAPFSQKIPSALQRTLLLNPSGESIWEELSDSGVDQRTR